MIVKVITLITNSTGIACNIRIAKNRNIQVRLGFPDGFSRSSFKHFWFGKGLPPAGFNSGGS